MAQKIGILSSQRGWHVLALEEALSRKGAVPCFYPITHLAARTNGRSHVEVGTDRLEDCQAILVRTIPIGSLEQIIFRMDALHRLENVGARVFNSPTTIERTVDKYYTDFILRDAGILVPKTVVTEDFDQALEAFREMGDVVVKPMFGSEGKGMRRVSDEDTAYRVFRALELDRYIFYIQEYIPHGREDIRAFVVGDQVVAAMRRIGNSWKTNVSQGAQVESIELSDPLKELSIQAARLVGADYAGVDLLPAEDGRIFVLEVNSIPGWRGLCKTVTFNIADTIVDYVLKSIKKDGR
ncbi:MAG: RimK family alpha-L-glutamate ligase [Anaerolineaceae bacterium]|nr:RimK family alpha-L-glutamate ligase [Anaerolineaceae bacterium]